MISSIEVPWEPLGFKRSLPSPEALKIFVCKHQMKSVMKFLHKNVGFFLQVSILIDRRRSDSGSFQRKKNLWQQVRPIYELHHLGKRCLLLYANIPKPFMPEMTTIYAIYKDQPILPFNDLMELQRSLVT